MLRAALLLLLTAAPTAVRVPAGTFAPLFGADRASPSRRVAGFRVDARLVTNGDFAAFVRGHPEWSKGAPPELFADGRFLEHWEGEDAPPAALVEAPVVHVSWFAARAYCEARGGRLPTTLEWEYLADAPSAAARTEHNARILQWYSRPFRMEDLLRPTSAPPSPHGVRQLHEYVWEWTEDFNGTFLTGDNRQDGDSLEALFCGGGSGAAAIRDDYAAFMRYALRGSLRASYAITNLGFRCAYDLTGGRR